MDLLPNIQQNASEARDRLGEVCLAIHTVRRLPSFCGKMGINLDLMPPLLPLHSINLPLSENPSIIPLTLFLTLSTLFQSTSTFLPLSQFSIYDQEIE